MRPASKHQLDEKGRLKRSETWFEWFYYPRDISFKQTLKEFTDLFETIISEQTQGHKVILPLSGGLDSRTQAVALKGIGADVFSYSYQFENGFQETKIPQSIAKVCDFDFKAYEIKKGYLWSELENLFEINHGFSDFSTPRQMYLYHDLKNKGDVFSLGHWGDVLFDSLNLSQLSDEETVEVIINKITKRGGLKFASELWNSWGLQGNFSDYLRARVEVLLKNINIGETNCKIKAFKSMYWAPRWTSVNLSIFSKQKPISLPYYDERMCKFVCTVPEQFLRDRRLQIAYIKLRNPKLAKIMWEEQKPFNLYTYHYNKLPYNFPYRLKSKISRIIKSTIGKPYVQRNWELQLLGESNKAHLKKQLFDMELDQWIPKSLISSVFNGFYMKDPVEYAQAINVLLVLSIFNQKKQK